MKCPQCGGGKIARDYLHAESYCADCGYVIEERIPDLGPEWRAFDKEQLELRTRVGSPVKFGKVTGLTTEIDRYFRDIKGTPVEEREKWQRLVKWQLRARTATSLQRNLSIALPELARIVSILKLSDAVHEECGRLYRKVVSEGLVKGRSIEAMVAATIYIVSRQHRNPVTLEELEEVSGVKKKEIMKGYKKIVQAFDLKVPKSTPLDYVFKIGSRLGASGATLAKAAEIVKAVQQRGTLAGKTPISVAAAAVYLAAELVQDPRISQAKVEGIFGASKKIIRERYEELKREVVLSA